MVCLLPRPYISHILEPLMNIRCCGLRVVFPYLTLALARTAQRRTSAIVMPNVLYFSQWTTASRLLLTKNLFSFVTFQFGIGSLYNILSKIYSIFVYFT